MPESSLLPRVHFLESDDAKSAGRMANLDTVADRWEAKFVIKNYSFANGMTLVSECVGCVSSSRSRNSVDSIIGLEEHDGQEARLLDA